MRSVSKAYYRPPFQDTKLMKLFRRLKKTNEAAEPEGNRFYGLFDVDQKLRNHINFRDGFYVELGANDGKAQSNSLHFEQELNWTGVLIEPIPHQFLSCRKNRSSRNKIYCAACVPFTYSNEFVPILYSNLMSTSLNDGADLDITAREHAEIGKQFLASHEDNFVFGALARTLTSILDESGAPSNIDLLSLDVEGHELNVLDGLDFQKYRFGHIIIESRNFPKTKDYLIGKGYRFAEQLSNCDLLFKG